MSACSRRPRSASRRTSSTRITPCQFGGTPDCAECGCMASAGLEAVGAAPAGRSRAGRPDLHRLGRRRPDDAGAARVAGADAVEPPRAPDTGLTTRGHPAAGPADRRVKCSGCRLLFASHSLAAGSLPASTAGISAACAASSSRPTRAGNERRRKRSAGNTAAPAATATTTRPSPTRESTPSSSRCRRRVHLDLVLQALAAGKHVLVEKPAFPEDGRLRGRCARRAIARAASVLVGENDHYKPLAVTLRRLLADGAIGEHGLRALHDDRAPAQDRRRLAQRRVDGRRRRVLRGRHPLAAHRRQPRTAHHAIARVSADAVARGARPAREEHDGGVPTTTTAPSARCIYSREVPSLFRGLRLSKLFGRRRRHHVRVERRVRHRPRRAACRGSSCPGFRDIRGYQAMYRDFVRAIRHRRAPEMSLERAIEDHRLMEQIYAASRS